MQRDLTWAILAAAVWGFVGSARAFEPEPVPNGRKIEQEELVELGVAVSRVDLYHDNVFQYDSQVEKLTASAAAMEGGTIEVLLAVRRVIPGEVFCEPLDAGRTRMILKHSAPPYFGTQRTVWYPAQPSAEYLNMLSKPIGVRIGDEITLEMAKELRKRDVLRVVGRIEQMPIRINGEFRPYVAAVVVDWKVVEVIVDPDAETIRY